MFVFSLVMLCVPLRLCSLICRVVLPYVFLSHVILLVLCYLYVIVACMLFGLCVCGLVCVCLCTCLVVCVCAYLCVFGCVLSAVVVAAIAVVVDFAQTQSLQVATKRRYLSAERKQQERTEYVI